MPIQITPAVATAGNVAMRVAPAAGLAVLGAIGLQRLGQPRKSKFQQRLETAGQMAKEFNEVANAASTIASVLDKVLGLFDTKAKAAAKEAAALAAKREARKDQLEELKLQQLTRDAEIAAKRHELELKKLERELAREASRAAPVSEPEPVEMEEAELPPPPPAPNRGVTVRRRAAK